MALPNHRCRTEPACRRGEDRLPRRIAQVPGTPNEEDNPGMGDKVRARLVDFRALLMRNSVEARRTVDALAGAASHADAGHCGWRRAP